MGDGGDRAARATEHDPTVLGVALAGIVAVVIDEDDWDLYDSMVGVVLLLVLLAYGRFRRQTVASRAEAAAVGSVWAFCVVLILGFAIDRFQGRLGWPPARDGATTEGFWFCAAWLLLAVVFAAILHRSGERLLHPRYRAAEAPLDPPAASSRRP